MPKWKSPTSRFSPITVGHMAKKVVENSLKVEREAIPRVLAYFSIDLSEIDRIQVFDGKPKIGERCAS